MLDVLQPLGLLMMAFLAPDPAQAEAAQKLFDSLYAPKIKAVAATRDGKDDLALAGELLTVAQGSTEHPYLLRLLCDSVYTLASKDPQSVPQAVEAMQLVIEHVADQRDAAHEKVIDLRQRQYSRSKPADKVAAGELLVEALLAAADAKAQATLPAQAAELTLLRRALPVASAIKSARAYPITDRIDDLARRQRAQDQIARLKAALLADANDAGKAVELTLLLVTEMDSPAMAAQYLSLVKDDTLKKRVELAAKPAGELDEAQSLDLGDWYRDHSIKADGAATKKAMLTRTRAYYGQFLKTHGTGDLPGKKASLAMKEIEAQIGKLETPPAAVVAKPRADEWIDLIKLLDPEQDTIKGKWTKEGKTLLGPEISGAKIAVPVQPQGDYTLRLSFQRKAGVDAVIFILPIGDAQAIVVIDGWSEQGSRSGLEAIDNAPGNVNITTIRGMQLTNGKTHKAEVTVNVRDGQASVKMELDGKKFIDWSGKTSSLSTGWAMPNQQLGLGSSSCTVQYESAQLKMLKGEAKITRK